MVRKLAILISILVLATAKTSSAQSNWRIGFGYSSKDGDAVIDHKLEPPDISATYSITTLPSQCFRGNGITGVSGVATKGGFNRVTALVSVTNMYDKPVVIECGATKTPVNLFFEHNERGSTQWRIISRPSTTAWRYVLLRRLRLVAKDSFDFEPDAASANIIRVKTKSSKAPYDFLYGVGDGQFLAGYNLETKTQQGAFDTIVRRLGFKVLSSGPSKNTPGQLRTVVSLGIYAPNTFFSTYQNSFTDAARLYSNVLSLKIDDLETGIRNRR